MDINERRGFNEHWPGEGLKEDGAAQGIRPGCGHRTHGTTCAVSCYRGLCPCSACSPRSVPEDQRCDLPTAAPSGAAVVMWAEPEPLGFPLFVLQSLLFSSSSVLHPSPLLSTHLPCGDVQSAVLFPHALLSYLSKSIVSIFSFIPCPFFL